MIKVKTTKDAMRKTLEKSRRAALHQAIKFARKLNQAKECKDKKEAVINIARVFIGEGAEKWIVRQLAREMTYTGIDNEEVAINLFDDLILGMLEGDKKYFKGNMDLVSELEHLTGKWHVFGQVTEVEVETPEGYPPEYGYVIDEWWVEKEFDPRDDLIIKDRNYGNKKVQD